MLHPVRSACACAWAGGGGAWHECSNPMSRTTFLPDACRCERCWSSCWAASSRAAASRRLKTWMRCWRWCWRQSKPQLSAFSDCQPSTALPSTDRKTRLAPIEAVSITSRPDGMVSHGQTLGPQQPRTLTCQLAQCTSERQWLLIVCVEPSAWLQLLCIARA
jgi:hypothetical protein